MPLNFKTTYSFIEDLQESNATPFAGISDLNNDGIDEVLIFRGHPTMWTNNWQGFYSKLDFLTFSPFQITTNTFDNRLTLVNGIRIGDFDKDGKYDVFLGDGGADIPSVPGSSPLIVWSFNQTIKSSNITTLPIKTFSHQISIADINLDGNTDLFIGGNLILDQPLSFLLINNGSGNFVQSNNLLPKYAIENTEIKISNTTSYRLNYSGASFLDANRDGFPDLALFATSRNQESIILLNNRGNFASNEVITLPAGLYGKGLVIDSGNYPEQGTRNWTDAWADVNLDGYPDLLLSQVLVDRITGKNYWGGQLQLLINQEGKSFLDVTPTALTGMELPKQNGTNYFEPRFADIDSDGDPDIVANYLVSNQQGGNKIFINDGTGKYSLDTTLTSSGWFIPFYANSDGSLDLLHFQDKIYGNDSLLGQSGKYGLFNRTFTIYENQLTNPMLTGSIGMDKLRGDQKNNIFNPSLADDVVDGNNGVDTVVFMGKSSDYIKHGVYPYNTIIDKIALRDGTDTLTNVERLKFTDTNVALDIGPTQNAGSVYMLYKAAFNRAPDEGGMGYWLAQKDGGSNIVTNIAQGFVASKEFTDKYGTNPTNASYVDKLYQNVLGRAGEAGGVTYWNQELDAGRISKAAVLVQFATLPEGAALVANLIANGIAYTEWVG